MKHGVNGHSFSPNKFRPRIKRRRRIQREKERKKKGQFFRETKPNHGRNKECLPEERESFKVCLV
jgi:hypothetical protein